MATGTNDVFTPPEFAAEVDRTMSIAGPNRARIWVNTQMVVQGLPPPKQLATARTPKESSREDSSQRNAPE